MRAVRLRASGFCMPSIRTRAAAAHVYSTHGHPEELYLEMARLAGALCTFTLEHHPRAIPAVRSSAAGQMLRCARQTDPPAARDRAADQLHRDSADLRRRLSALRNGDRSRCLGRSTWVFAIRSNIGAAELIRKTLELIKICSEEFVKKLVSRSLPGLTLTHMALPPRAISASVETQYFMVNKQGPCWDHIVATRRVGVYVPGEFWNPQIELLVVLDS